MTGSNETKTFTLSIPTQWADLANSVWGKTVAILAAVSIVMGILLELEGLITGYYAMKKTAFDADISESNAVTQRALSGRDK